MAILNVIRNMARWTGFLVIALIIVALGNSPGVYSALELAVSPYEFRLARWEIANVPDKWWHELAGTLPWASRDGPTPGQLLRDFAALSGDLRSAQAELYRLAASGSDTSATDAQMRSDGARRSMDAHSPWAQAVMESQITSVLKQEGLGSFLGTVFPPVDVVFTDAPLVLVASPRDRIERQHSSLLDNRMTVAEMESLEDRLLQEQNLASLVLQTGGLASYPSMVNASGDLFHLTSTSVHEWLHQYWFFHPLGRNYFANPTMTTLNETAADLAGDELGATAYEAITGEPAPVTVRPEYEGPHDHSEAFNFNREMRTTRLEADRLLEENRIEDAEAYMEKQRRVFVQNGYNLRKLNQAYFAFHGSYGSSPASVSPIQGQVERVRAHATSIGEFVRTMSQFGTYEEFEAYVANLPPLQVVPDASARGAR